MLALLWASCSAAGTPAWLVSNRLTLGGDPNAAVITSVAVDAQGDNVVAGVVGSAHFPGIDSAQVVNAGYGARFVARYDALTQAQQFVAVVGSARAADGRLAMAGLALDANGNAYVPAFAASLDFPAAGGVYVAAGLPYVHRVTTLGQVSRLSAPLDAAIRTVRAIAVDAAGNVYLTGSAGAGLVASPGAPYGTSAVAAGCMAPYVLKLDRTGAPVYSTYLGYAGAQGERCGGNYVGGPFDPGGYAIAVDAAGNAYVTGQAEPGVRATPGAVDLAPTLPTTVRGGPGVASHAFVSKINSAGTALVFTARLGGNSHDRGTAIVLDGTGNAYIAGKTTTYGFPRAVTAWPQVNVLRECLLDTPELGFLAKVSADGTRLVWAGLLPAAGTELDDCTLNGVEAPVSLAVDASGYLFATGFTDPSNRLFTLSRNALQPVDGEGFLVQVDATGQLLYSTWLSGGTDAIAVDGDQNLRLAGGASTQQLSAGSAPLAISARVDPACAGAPTSIDVRVAGAGNHGAVDIQVDGTSIGFAAVRAGVATLAPSLAPGVRRIAAVFHGVGPFDGYVSGTLFLAVNQAGACS